MTPTKTTKKSKVVAPLPSLPTNPFVFEILDLVSQQRANAKKVEVLKTYEHDALKSILKWNFDPGIISLIPEGDVPYGDAQDQTIYSGSLSENIAREAAGGESATGQDLDGRNKTSIRHEYKNFYHFVKGGNNELTTTRREMIFINMLQGLHPKEAELLCLVKDKDLESKYSISLENVKQAYPQMTWGSRG